MYRERPTFLMHGLDISEDNPASDYFVEIADVHSKKPTSQTLGTFFRSIPGCSRRLDRA